MYFYEDDGMYQTEEAWGTPGLYSEGVPVEEDDDSEDEEWEV